MIDLKNKKVLVTGGSGFLGRVIVRKLKERGAEVLAPRSEGKYRGSCMDLLSRASTENYFYKHSPEIAIHSAAHYGGIMINQTHPADIFYRNTVMYANIFEACSNNDVEKLVSVGTACSYPFHLTGLLNEDDLWSGPCHESVENYGGVKRMMDIAGRAYKKQYGLNSIMVILTNLYGKHDVFTDERSHVVAALLKKFAYATIHNENEVKVWGSGRPIREFLYVEDAAEAIVLATEKYDSTDPLNIGCGIGTKIRELVKCIAEVSGFKGKIVWDSSKPDGASKKVLNISKMKVVLDWYPRTSLMNGLEETFSWLVNNYDEAMARK